MNTIERIAQLKDAQGLIREAADIIEDALSGTSEMNRARAYLIPVLEMAIDNESGWLGDNPANIGSLIEALMDGE